ncbi:MAG: hypothetical protein RLY16_3041, partial [Bacteroidota bacterium]
MLQRIQCRFCPLFFTLCFSFFSIVSIAQSKPTYTQQWKMVATLETKGLHQQAAKKVQQVFQTAVKEKNEKQWLKAALHLMRYQNLLKEFSVEKNITYIQNLLSNSTGISTPILQNLLAELYSNYQTDHYWQISNLNLAQEISGDFKTWTISGFENHIKELYLSSLQNKSLLQNTFVADYTEIVIAGSNDKKLRPTLFDVLANQALDYFKNNNSSQPFWREEHAQNEDHFLSDDMRTFCSRIIVLDSNSKKAHFAFQLFQQLIQFHLNDAEPDALLDINLQRLQFAYENSHHPLKFQHFEAQ